MALGDLETPLLSNVEASDVEEISRPSPRVAFLSSNAWRWVFTGLWVCAVASTTVFTVKIASAFSAVTAAHTGLPHAVQMHPVSLKGEVVNTSMAFFELSASHASTTDLAGFHFSSLTKSAFIACCIVSLCICICATMLNNAKPNSCGEQCMICLFMMTLGLVLIVSWFILLIVGLDDFVIYLGTHSKLDPHLAPLLLLILDASIGGTFYVYLKPCVSLQSLCPILWIALGPGLLYLTYKTMQNLLPEARPGLFWFNVQIVIVLVFWSVKSLTEATSDGFYNDEEVVDTQLKRNARLAVLAQSIFALAFVFLCVPIGYSASGLAKNWVGVVCFLFFWATWIYAFIGAKLAHMKRHSYPQPSCFTYFRVRNATLVPWLLTLPSLYASSVLIRSFGYVDEAPVHCPKSSWQPIIIPTCTFDDYTPNLETLKAIGHYLAQVFLKSQLIWIMRLLVSGPWWSYGLLGVGVGIGMSHVLGLLKVVPSGAILIGGTGALMAGGMYASQKMRNTLFQMTRPPLLFPSWSGTASLTEPEIWQRTCFFVPLLILQVAILGGTVCLLYGVLNVLPARITHRALKNNTTISPRHLLLLFLIYHFTHNVLLFLLVSYALRNALISSSTGIDWELWSLWLLWLTLISASTCVCKYAVNFGQKLPSPMVNTLMQIMPGIGNDIHLFKDWVFIANCIHRAECNLGSLRFVGHLLAALSCGFLFWPLADLLADASSGEAFISAHWPVIADRPDLQKEEQQLQEDLQKEEQQLQERRYPPYPYAFNWLELLPPAMQKKVLQQAVNQTTRGKFIITLKTEAPQSLLAITYAVIFGGSPFVVSSIAMSSVKVLGIPTVQRALPPLLEAMPDATLLVKYVMETLEGRLSARVFSGGSTALHVAIEWGDAEGARACTKLLAEEKQGIETQNNCGQTPLALACDKRKMGIARILLQNGGACSIPGFEVLLRKGDAKGLKELLKASAGVDDANEKGLTPLMLCLKNAKNIENDIQNIAETLVQSNANVDATSPSGWSPVTFAAAQGLTSMIEYLVPKSATLHMKDSNASPLIEAVKNQHMDTAAALLDKDAVPTEDMINQFLKQDGHALVNALLSKLLEVPDPMASHYEAVQSVQFKTMQKAEEAVRAAKDAVESEIKKHWHLRAKDAVASESQTLALEQAETTLKTLKTLPKVGDFVQSAVNYKTSTQKLSKGDLCIVLGPASDGNIAKVNVEGPNMKSVDLLPEQYTKAEWPENWENRKERKKRQNMAVVQET